MLSFTLLLGHCRCVLIHRACPVQLLARTTEGQEEEQDARPTGPEPALLCWHGYRSCITGMTAVFCHATPIAQGKKCTLMTSASFSKSAQCCSLVMSTRRSAALPATHFSPPYLFTQDVVYVIIIAHTCSSTSCFVQLHSSASTWRILSTRLSSPDRLSASECTVDADLILCMMPGAALMSSSIWWHLLQDNTDHLRRPVML